MLSELDVMKSLQPHPHVVRLIGCCIDKGTGTLISVCWLFYFHCKHWYIENSCFSGYLSQ